MKALVISCSPVGEFWDRMKAKLTRRSAEPQSYSRSLVETSEPALPNSEWVRLRSIACGISDWDQAVALDGDPGLLAYYVEPPFVLGEEILALVLDPGADAAGAEPGERVIINPVLSCVPRGIPDLCFSCASGDPSRCRNLDAGTVSPGFMIGACHDTAGGWAESFVAHHTQIRSVPRTMDSDTAVLIPEFTRALRAVLSNRPLPGERALIIGAGSLGLLIIFALTKLSPDCVITTLTESPFEAQIARELFSSPVLTASGLRATYEDIADQLGARLTRGDSAKPLLVGGADVVFETTGIRSNIDHACRCAVEGGRVSLVGIRHLTGIDLSSLWARKIRLNAPMFSGAESQYGNRETFDVALQAAQEWDLGALKLPIRKFTLAQHDEAFAMLKSPETSKLVKAVFQHVV